MDEWQQKLHDFSEKAKAKGQQEGNAAENELKAAWTKVEAEQHKLQSASAEGWESAKISTWLHLVVGHSTLTEPT